MLNMCFSHELPQWTTELIVHVSACSFGTILPVLFGLGGELCPMARWPRLSCSDCDGPDGRRARSFCSRFFGATGPRGNKGALNINDG